MYKSDAFPISTIFGSISTYPSPKSAITLVSHLGQNVGLGEGSVGSFLETQIDPNFLQFLRKSIIGFSYKLATPINIAANVKLLIPVLCKNVEKECLLCVNCCV